MRKSIAIGEYYHIYNRGVDKRSVILDKKDSDRFLESVKLFNTKNPIGSIYEFKRYGDETATANKLVEIVCYCVNPNHFHFLLKEVKEGGISQFMKRLSGGYTWYFNNRHKRSGSLFQGVFKSVHIQSNEQLLHTSAYINLNWKAHQINRDQMPLVLSSWNEYVVGGVNSAEDMCSKKIIIGQFNSPKGYKEFALSSLLEIIRAKKERKEEGIVLDKYLFQ